MFQVSGFTAVAQKQECWLTGRCSYLLRKGALYTINSSFSIIIRCSRISYLAVNICQRGFLILFFLSAAGVQYVANIDENLSTTW